MFFTSFLKPIELVRSSCYLNLCINTLFVVSATECCSKIDIDILYLIGVVFFSNQASAVRSDHIKIIHSCIQILSHVLVSGLLSRIQIPRMGVYGLFRDHIKVSIHLQTGCPNDRSFVEAICFCRSIYTFPLFHSSTSDNKCHMRVAFVM